MDSRDVLKHFHAAETVGKVRQSRRSLHLGEWTHSKPPATYAFRLGMPDWSGRSASEPSEARVSGPFQRGGMHRSGLTKRDHRIVLSEK